MNRTENPPPTMQNKDGFVTVPLEEIPTRYARSSPSSSSLNSVQTLTNNSSPIESNNDLQDRDTSLHSLLDPSDKGKGKYKKVEEEELDLDLDFDIEGMMQEKPNKWMSLSDKYPFLLPIALISMVIILLIFVISRVTTPSTTTSTVENTATNVTAGLRPPPTIKVPGKSMPKHKTQNPITFDDLVTRKISFGLTSDSYKFIPFNGEDGYHLTFNGDFVVQHITNQQFSQVLISGEQLSSIKKHLYSLVDFELSGDSQFLRIDFNRRQIARRSYLFDAYVVHVADPSKLKTFVNLQYAQFTPNNNLVYVKENNIYYYYPTTDKEIQITKDGSEMIFNGVPDWVYEEEVFSDRYTLWVTSNIENGGMETIAFLKLDETNVPVVEVASFDGDGPNRAYEQPRKIKYPKVDAPNPIVSLHIVSVPIVTKQADKDEDESVVVTEEVNVQKVDFDIIQSLKDILITEVQWITTFSSSTNKTKRAPTKKITQESKALVRIMNRVQDQQYLYQVSLDHGKWKSQLVRSHIVEDGAWWDRLQTITTIPDGGYLDLIERDGWYHVKYFSGEIGDEGTWLTGGEWDVTEIVGVSKKFVWILSTEMGSTQRHLYRVTYDGHERTHIMPRFDVSGDPLLELMKNASALQLPPEFTPDSTTIHERGFFIASASKLSQFIVMCNRGPGVPYCGIHDTVSHNWTTIIDNKHSYSLLKQYDLPYTVYGTLKLDDGTELNTKLVIPPDAIKSNTTSYPILMRCYGGPSSQMVQMTTEFHLNEHIATQHNIIVATVDNRGTGFRGRKFRSVVTKQLGIQESNDQISAAKILKKWIGEEYGIGIWGWSFGGYLTLKSIERSWNVFKAAVAVAPVVNWKFYDSVYTERYMKLYKDNEDGYKLSAVSNMTSFMASKTKTLVMHGLADDNVHFQNTQDLLFQAIREFGMNHQNPAYKLENFRTAVFPNSDHSISYGSSLMYLYRLLTEFVSDELLGETKLVKRDRVEYVQGLNVLTWK